MTAHITYARPTVRGPKLVLTAAVAVMLAMSMLTMGGPTANAASPGPSLGMAGSFAILSAADGGGGAVTCVNEPNPATIIGNVGSSGVITPGACTITGSQIAPVSGGVVTAFDKAYAALGQVQCTTTILTTAYTDTTLTLGSGVTCFPDGVTFTRTTLTLTGSGPWLIEVGSLATGNSGALTGTNLHMVLPAGANPCDVTWWVRAGATMTTSNATGTQFFGTILAGAAITVTGADVGTFDGRALAKAAVSITGGRFTGCTGGSLGGGGGNGKAKCNQGVGNGPEGCDPGNSNQGDPSRSNDENGGTPGDPGRQGGNGK
ncbi:MAG: ice-binding family protein [Chloroflexota bacterium]